MSSPLIALRGTRADALPVRTGTLAAVCLSSMGKVLLSRESDAMILRIARHANAVDPVSRNRVHPQSLLEQIRVSEARGWAESHEFPSPGHCSIAAALPVIPRQPLLALCIGSSTAIMHRERQALVTALTHACENFAQMTQRAASE